MIDVIHEVLTGEEVANFRRVLEDAPFLDGRMSAGVGAKLVKSNRHACELPAVKGLQEAATLALLKNPTFRLNARPVRVLTAFNRYRVDDRYGSHVDDAFMDEMRTDVSFTLFLSDPSTYEGGELVLEHPTGEQPFKLPAGSAVVYPSNTLHRVERIRSGERLACFGWVRSRLREPAQRAIVRDLEVALASLFTRDGKTKEADLIGNAILNLTRRWGD